MSSFFGRKTHLKKEFKKTSLLEEEEQRGEGRIGPWHARSRMWGGGMGAALMRLQQLQRLLIMLMLALLLLLLPLQQQNNRIN